MAQMTQRDERHGELVEVLKAAVDPRDRWGYRFDKLADAVLAWPGLAAPSQPAVPNDAETELRTLHDFLDALGAPQTIYNPYDHLEQPLNVAGRLHCLLDPKNEGLTPDRIARMLEAVPLPAPSAESVLTQVRAECAATYGPPWKHPNAALKAIKELVFEADGLPSLPAPKAET